MRTPRARRSDTSDRLPNYRGPSVVKCSHAPRFRRRRRGAARNRSDAELASLRLYHPGRAHHDLEGERYFVCHRPELRLRRASQGVAMCGERTDLLVRRPQICAGNRERGIRRVPHQPLYRLRRRNRDRCRAALRILARPIFCLPDRDIVVELRAEEVEMSVLRICAILGCETRTLGQFCVAHETSPTRRQTVRRQPRWRSTPQAARRRNVTA